MNLCISLGYPYAPYFLCLPRSLRSTIQQLVRCRQRNGIHAKSKLDILCAEADMYVARIDDKLTLKLGPRYDMGRWVPAEKEGWHFVCSGGSCCRPACTPVADMI